MGVDVSLGRGLDVALVEDGRILETWTRVGSEGLKELLTDLRPDAVGLDAPPRPGLGLLRDEEERQRLAVPPAPGRHVDRRIAEYELSRRGIGSHQTPRDESRLFSWMTAGFEAFIAAAGAGYELFLGEGSARGRAFEVFPYASYVAMAGCLSPGRRWRLAWRRAVLDQAGVRDLPDDARIDTVDAACAALTAERFLRGSGSWVGHPREGVIVLPVPELCEAYHRCAAPEAGGTRAVRPARAAADPRLCECGCGSPVRRRFLPGHDARLRSRLLTEARTGETARRELERLGWLHFLDEDGGSREEASRGAEETR
jgi:Protein of unknown function (DUF429)